ncbi:MAG: polyprenol monophosphomannose synthase [Deltaproteobacteria bacterium]|nr:polyprenol monophosphomannose synthase [Deltaproteobacteria bacterium]
MNKKSLVIVPTYNEAKNIGPLVGQIFAILPSLSILFVDDNSPDGTLQRIEDVQKQHPMRIDVISRSGKLGLGTAYIAGFRWGLENGFDYFIEMDADFSHDPRYLPRFLELLETNDVVVGSRYIPGGGTKNWNWLRRLISRAGSFYARTVLGLRLIDLTGGFNAWRRNVLESIGLDRIKSEGYAFQIELKYRAHLKGFRIVESPIIFVDRLVGTSKMSKKIVWEAIYRVLMLRFGKHSEV